MLSDIHMVLGIGVLASNALAGGWGAIAWLRRDPSVIFWYLLRAAQAIVVVQVLLGLGVLAGGTRAPDSLHVLYGTLPLAVTLVSEGLRIQAAGRVLDEAGVDDLERLDRREQVLIARRVVLHEMGIMSVGALVIVTLALRAMSTGGIV